MGLAPSGKQGAYHNFRVAIYVVVGTTRQLADRRTLEEQYSRITRQLRFDKVYLEVYRNRQFADEGSLEAIKKFFTDRGIAVSGGVTLAAGGQGGQFGTFDFEQPADRAECQRAVELAARHFDEVILDSCCGTSNVDHRRIEAQFLGRSSLRSSHKSEAPQPVGELGAIDTQSAGPWGRNGVWEDLR